MISPANTVCKKWSCTEVISPANTFCKKWSCTEVISPANTVCKKWSCTEVISPANTVCKKQCSDIRALKLTYNVCNSIKCAMFLAVLMGLSFRISALCIEHKHAYKYA